MAYENTTVPLARSQREIRKLLADAGATQFAFGEDQRPDQLGRRPAATDRSAAMKWEDWLLVTVIAFAIAALVGVFAGVHT